ncbi:MAG TPA: hypothetical protein VD931_15210 [Baekduia sp.]|nr:hypothetical protein [Baekduia sp.]
MTRRGRAVIAALATGALALLSGGGVAHGGQPCVSSTPATATVADIPDEQPGTLTPDARSATLSLDATCTLTVTYTVATPTAPQHFWTSYFDTDANAETGGQLFNMGAEYVIARTPGEPPVLLRQTRGAGSAPPDVTLVKELVPAGENGAMVHLDDLGVTPGVPLGFQGVVAWSDTESEQFHPDFVPELELAPLRFSFTFSTQPPAPPAPPAPAAPQPQPAPPAAPLTPPVLGQTVTGPKATTPRAASSPSSGA